MFVAINNDSPTVTITNTDYVVRVGRTVRGETGSPPPYAIVAFSLLGNRHVPISQTYSSLEAAREAFFSGFEVAGESDEVSQIMQALVESGMARRAS